MQKLKTSFTSWFHKSTFEEKATILFFCFKV